MMEILFLGIGLALGGLMSFLFFRNQPNATMNAQLEQFKQQINVQGLELAKHQEKASYLEKELEAKKSETSLLRTEKEGLSRFVEKAEIQEKELEERKAELVQLRTEKDNLDRRLTESVAKFREQETRMSEQKQELENLQKRFQTEFENIANKLLKQNSEEFTKVNEKAVGDLLLPLKDRLKEFEKKVEDTYEKESKQRFALEKEIKTLAELNQQISKEATELTNAMKGQNKLQGNWGELILEKLLEQSGLRTGIEYTVQAEGMRLENEEGRRFQPDVIINLPENRHLVIDSKVSLLAWNDLTNAETEERKLLAQNELVKSLKTHINGLHDKHYHNLGGLNSLDFVLMFIPIEGSFSAAMQLEPNLFGFAWEKRIVLVTPTTLMATLKTIASIWKHEHQNQNAMEIARQGGALYDKFAAFYEDMQKIKRNLDLTTKSYDEAMVKLQGRGGLSSRAQSLKELGVKASKKLPPEAIGLDELIEGGEE
ncbi:MAG: DNA recombination protein RmuC [Bacteroidia bacterium]|nr:DNA recombination protein RmuC [Bacteroidia bacterium]